jgi:GntR family transcriptional regulator
MMTQMQRIKADKRSLSIQTREHLVGLIKDGIYEPGQQLPSEADLAAQLGISRSTLREALRSFEERGIITRRQGVGTFVNASYLVIETGLETLVSLDSLARDKGLDCTTWDLLIEEQPADKEVATKLSVPQGTPIIVVSRTKIADGKPVAWMYDVLPESIAELEEVKANFKGSVLDFLLERQSPSLSHAWANIVATKAGRSLAQKLDVKPTSALLLLEEFLYSTSGYVVEYSRNYFVSGFFRFHIVRHIPTTISSLTSSTST